MTENGSGLTLGWSGTPQCKGLRLQRAQQACLDLITLSEKTHKKPIIVFLDDPI